MPVSGVFSTFLSRLTLDWDRALEPGPLDLANWRLRYNNFRWDAISMTAGLPAAHQSTGNFTNTGIPQPPGTALDYLPPPFDVRGVTGVPAAAFSDFPITPV